LSFKNYLSKVYNDEIVVEQMRRSFENEGVLRIDGFMVEISHTMLLENLEDVKGEKNKIANKYSYVELENVKELEEIFKSGDFCSFISKIVNKELRKVKVNVNKFGHRDYTLLHDNNLEVDRIEFIFMIGENWDESYGGQIVYKDEKEEGIVFSFEGNSFCLIDRKKGMGKFVKYVNHLSGKNSIYIIEGYIE
jgi:hypothetical protein